LCKSKTPTSAVSGEFLFGGTIQHPYMSAWPWGSNIVVVGGVVGLLACWLIILGVFGSSFLSLLANHSRRLCLLGRGIARAMAGLAHRSRRCWLMCLLGLRMAGAMAGWSIVLAGGVVV
jgi:hypothetical protein